MGGSRGGARTGARTGAGAEGGATAVAVPIPGADPRGGILWRRAHRGRNRGSREREETLERTSCSARPGRRCPPLLRFLPATERPRPWGRIRAPWRPSFEARRPPSAAAAQEGTGPGIARPCALRPRFGSLPPPPAAMAGAAPKGAGSGRRRPPPPGLRTLLLLCLWLPSGRAAGPLPAPLSGVEQLLGEFRRQLQQERPQEELELELRAGGGPPPGCPGPGGGGYSAMPDAIIRTKDSIAAGASFLSAPAAVRDWRQCVAACCAEPRCSVAVVELPRRPAPPAAALGCYLFNCTARGRNVCRFALHRGYSSYSLGRALEGQRDLGAGFPATARASPRLGKQAPGEARARPLGPCCPCTCWVAASGRPAWQDLWALLTLETPCSRLA